MQHSKQITGYGYIKPLNYGVSVSYSVNNLLLSTGISHITQGVKYRDIEVAAEDLPEGGIGKYDMFLRVRGLMVPINIDYLYTLNKISLIGGVGLYSGYIYHEQFENTSVSENDEERFVNTQYFKKIYWGINIGLGLKYFINDKLHMQLRPNFLYYFFSLLFSISMQKLLQRKQPKR